MSDTPRTARIYTTMWEAYGGKPSAEFCKEMTAFAQTLEREVAALREALESVKRFAIAGESHARQHYPHLAGDFSAIVAVVNPALAGQPCTSDRVSDAGTLRQLVKASEVILGLWSETELDPEDEDYEHWMAAFNESVTGYLAEARAALAGNVPARWDAPVPAPGGGEGSAPPVEDSPQSGGDGHEPGCTIHVGYGVCNCAAIREGHRERTET